LLLGGREVVAAERGGGFVDVKGTARLIHFKFEPMVRSWRHQRCLPDDNDWLS
jgi:hypothetical protein